MCDHQVVEGGLGSVHHLDLVGQCAVDGLDGDVVVAALVVEVLEGEVCGVGAGVEEAEPDVDLPAVPRIGEQILWCDWVTGEDGEEYERQREYRVRMADWTFSSARRGSRSSC